MEEFEIKRAVRNCTKCQSCYGKVEETCPMNVEFDTSPFSPPRVFQLAEGIFHDYIKLSQETSIVPFACTMCGACAKRCGASFLHFAYEYPTKLIEGIRGLFLEEGAVPEQISEVLRNVYNTKNAWGLPQNQRVEWEKKSEIPIPDYSKERNEFLLFVGDASLIPETQHIPRVVAKLLQRGGVDFGTLKEEEVDSGNETREMGESGLFEAIAEENIETFKELGVKKIITISPHDYHTFRHDYPELGIEFERLYHYTEIISDLVREGKIKPTQETPKSVTFQDPCHLGRYNGIYQAPRDIIRTIPGVEFIEMARTRDEAFCCGAGGGRMWYEPEDNRSQRISDVRVRHAREVDADIIVTACPYCLNNLQAAGNLDETSVKDIGELVLESIN